MSFLPDFRINKSLFAPFESLRAGPNDHSMACIEVSQVSANKAKVPMPQIREHIQNILSDDTCEASAAAKMMT
jgi:hypothetical protein